MAERERKSTIIKRDIKEMYEEKMGFRDIIEIKEIGSHEINIFLEKGWELINVFGGGSKHYYHPLYIVGWPREMGVPPTKRIKLKDIYKEDL